MVAVSDSCGSCWMLPYRNWCVALTASACEKHRRPQSASAGPGVCVAAVLPGTWGRSAEQNIHVSHISRAAAECNIVCHPLVVNKKMKPIRIIAMCTRDVCREADAGFAGALHPPPPLLHYKGWIVHDCHCCCTCQHMELDTES